MQPKASLLLAGVLLCAEVSQAGGENERKKDVPVYTDDDLRRISPLREQTGGGNPPPPVAPAPVAKGDAARGRGEDYWRREAERVRDRVQPLRERAEELRAQIEERRRSPGVRPYSDPRVESLQRRLSALEQRMHDMEDALHERARRAGALPSWLR